MYQANRKEEAQKLPASIIELNRPRNPKRSYGTTPAADVTASFGRHIQD
jgi:hypothetical protein